MKILLGVAGVWGWCVVPATVRVNASAKCSEISVIDLAGAKGEAEHVQLVADEVSSVDLSAAPGGADWWTWWQVGYVMVNETTRYEPSGGGWMADPLFTVDEGPGPFWLRVTIPRDADPGTSYGEIRVGSVRVEATLTVWDLEVPPQNQSAWDKVFVAGAADNRTDSLTALYGNYSSELQQKYYDLLTEHLMPPDDLYLSEPRPLKDYEYLRSKGQRWMGLMDVSSRPGGDGCANFSSEYVNSMIEDLRPIVGELGTLEDAYVYGFDEQPRECEAGVRLLFDAVKTAFPGLKTVAVLNWDDMPLDLPLNAWVLQYEEHDDARATEWVQLSNHSYWLYHCIEPSGSAYLNTFIERPLIQDRLLMWYGASLPQVSGWLYYAVDLWETGCPVNPEPHVLMDHVDALTNWNAGNCIWWPTYSFWANGDGQYIYPGPDGPISTIRLMNLRDAFEDVDLFRSLEQDQAKDLLTRLVRSPTDFTPNSTLLEATRRQAAALKGAS